MQGVVCRDMVTGQACEYDADAVIFAVGITGACWGWCVCASQAHAPVVAGMQKIVANSPALASRPEFCKIMNLQATDVIATRLWFDRKVNTRFSANVLAGFEDNCGGTFFNLNELQVDQLRVHSVLLMHNLLTGRVQKRSRVCHSSRLLSRRGPASPERR